jgi:hypothetical protein
MHLGGVVRASAATVGALLAVCGAANAAGRSPLIREDGTVEELPAAGAGDV